jgi:dTMP kinase
MIVTLEGIDASGKATQSKRLVQRLKENGVEAQRFDFPRYGSLSGQALLGILKREWFAARRPTEKVSAEDSTWPGDVTVELVKAPVETESMTALTIQALMTVNRYEHIEILQKYQSPTEEGVLVLDRYYGSGIAYGEADGLDGAFLRTIHAALPPSDLWLFIDIMPEESVRRRPARRDEYETRSGFMHKVRDRYLELFTNPTMPGEWVVIEGMGTEDEIHERIWDAFCARYDHTE